MKLRYKPHTPRLKIVDQYIRELFRDELPDGIKFHDADLDHLGREDFFKLDGKLREGRGARGIDVSDDAKWYKGTLKIIKEHQFYTETQKKLREKVKQNNIKKLLNKLENIEKKKRDPI